MDKPLILLNETISTNKFYYILICLASALLLGFFQAFVFSIKNRCTKSMVVTIVLIPASISMIIQLVNGSIGSGIAVAGAFSLVRFRSVPGSGKEIVAILVAMVTGLAIGTGYIEYALIFTIIGTAVILIMNVTNLFSPSSRNTEKMLRITIPEDLNYTTVFDDIFIKYLNKVERISAKTTNLGSMYKIKYRIIMKDINQEKLFIDELRCRNGNLEIMIYDDETDEIKL